MSIELVDDVGAELANLYAEWKAANARTAALLRDLRPGETLMRHQLTQIEQAEARAAALAIRYRSIAGELQRRAG